MNTTLLHRRRIERYARLLEEANGERPPSHARSSKDAELNELVTFGSRIPLDVPDVTMDTGRRAQIRAFLMATAEREGIGATAGTAKRIAGPVVGRARVGVAGKGLATRRIATSKAAKAAATVRTRTRTKGAILVGLAAGTLALSGISAASSTALPGEALYGLKLSQEHAQLVVADSNVAKGQLYLGFAAVRLGEAQAIRANSHKLGSVLNLMDSETQLGVKLLLTQALTKRDTDALASVNQFVTNQTSGLSELFNATTGADHARIAASITLLGKIGIRAQAIQAAITCGSIAGNGTDSLGPRPLVCPESVNVTPTPTHTSNGTGKSSTSGHRPGQPSGSDSSTPAGTAGQAGQAIGNDPMAVRATVGAADVTVVPSRSDADSGGLLGSIGHVLGGLLGH